jgi:hypothetical protein
MNRADKLLVVLQDGREHSRGDVFHAYGFMLTNNAASELRARGYDVQHRRRDGVDTYQLVSLDASSSDASSFLGDVAEEASSGLSNQPHADAPAFTEPELDGGPLVHPLQPALFEAA